MKNHVLKLYGFLILLLWYELLIISVINADSLSNNDSAFLYLNKSDTLRIMCVGDIMTHLPQIKTVQCKKKYNFTPFFQNVSPFFRRADLVIGNLETVLAGDTFGITGYPAFNGPQSLAYYLKSAGITMLTTANNHSFDRGIPGIKNTIRLLDSLRILHTGTFTDTTTTNRPLIVSVKNFQIGIMSYSYGTNGCLSIQAHKYINIIDTSALKRDINFLKSKNVDIIVASIHFGTEYTKIPSDSQKMIVSYLWDNGVSVIFGHHSHLLQPFIYDTVNNKFAAFSLGNFMTNQFGGDKEFGGIADIVLKKSKGDSIVRIESATVHPTLMYQWYDHASPKYKILLLNNIINKNSHFKYLKKNNVYVDTIPYIYKQLHSLDGKFYYVRSRSNCAPDSCR